MRAPIHSNKHYLQKSLSTVTAGAVDTFRIADAVQVPGTGAEDVIVGCIIKAVFVEMWVRGGELAEGAIQLALTKTQLDSNGPTFTEMGNMMDYNEKKNVLFFSQGLTNGSGSATVGSSTALPMIRQWFKIPKSKQRFGLGDGLSLVAAGLVLDSVWCGFATYKEYT